MQNNHMGKEQEDPLTRQQCEYCQYFQENEYTGYCQIHHAYVVKTFLCEKFVPHYSSVKKG
jgi:hypothetical protein